MLFANEVGCCGWTVDVLNPQQAPEVNFKVWKWRPHQVRVRPPAAAARCFDNSSRPGSLYLQPAEAGGRHSPEPSPAHSGPRGPATHRTANLRWPLLCSGPLGPPPISSGTTHNLSVSTLCPLSTSTQRALHYSAHAPTRARPLYTQTKGHTQTLYRHHKSPHANTICRTQPCTASVSLCLSCSLRFPLSSPLSVSFMRSKGGTQLYTGEYPHLVDNVHVIKRCSLSVYAAVWKGQSTGLFCVPNPSGSNSVFDEGCSNTFSGVSAYQQGKSNFNSGHEHAS